MISYTDVSKQYISIQIKVQFGHDSLFIFLCPELLGNG